MIFKIIHRYRERIRRDKGFTLVELLVTVTIIGILAAVVTVGVSGAASNSQVKANQALFSGYQTLIDAWLAANPQQDPEKTVPISTAIFLCRTDTDTATVAGCNSTTSTGSNFKWYGTKGEATTQQTLKAFLELTYPSPSPSQYNAANGYAAINPKSDTMDPDKTKVEFNKFFRLGNAAASTICVVSTAATNNVLACKN